MGHAVEHGCPSGPDRQGRKSTDHLHAPERKETCAPSMAGVWWCHPLQTPTGSTTIFSYPTRHLSLPPPGPCGNHQAMAPKPHPSPTFLRVGPFSISISLKTPRGRKGCEAALVAQRRPRPHAPLSAMQISQVISVEDFRYQITHLDEDKRRYVLVTTIALSILPAIAVFMRFWARRVNKAPWKQDDYAIVVALVWKYGCLLC